MKFVMASEATEENIDAALDAAFEKVVSKEVHGAIFGKKYVQVVVDTVCNERRVERADVLSANRVRPVAWARQEAQYIVHRTTVKTFPQIGKEFDRDHTTVIHSINAVKRRMKDAEYKSEVGRMMVEARNRYEKINPVPR